MNPLAIIMFSRKKLNTYGVESPCECLPRVVRYARQPRAIKRTTRIELRGENIHHGGFIHGNAGITSTVLRFFLISSLSIGKAAQRMFVELTNPIGVLFLIAQGWRA